MADTAIRANMADDREASRHGGMTLSQILSLDMLATSVKNGWKNPIYFASTVPSDYYIALQPLHALDRYGLRGDDTCPQRGERRL